MAILKVGTSQTLIARANPARKRITITFQSSQVDSSNTGQVFVGFGHQPQSVVSDPAAGYPIKQSDVIERPRVGEELMPHEKLDIWAVSDTAAQSLIIEEE